MERSLGEARKDPAIRSAYLHVQQSNQAPPPPPPPRAPPQQPVCPGGATTSFTPAPRGGGSSGGAVDSLGACSSGCRLHETIYDIVQPEQNLLI